MKKYLVYFGAALLAAAYAVRVATLKEGSLEIMPGDAGIVELPGGADTMVKVTAFDEKRYVTTAVIDGEDVQIFVNHPYRKNFLQIWQSSLGEVPGMGYYTELGWAHDYSPPIALAGAVVLLFGAWWMVFSKEGGAKRAKPSGMCTIALAVLGAGALAALVWRVWTTREIPLANVYEFLMVSAVALPLVVLSFRDAAWGDVVLEILLVAPLFFMNGAHKPLPPALQSPFFVPHVGAYVFGYVFAFRALFSLRRSTMPLAFAFISTGLLLGAAWGQVCWGRWWDFDPKETWSLATWLACAGVFHTKPGTKAEKIAIIATGVLVFLTLTWANFSRLFPGMHSYA